MNIITIVPLIIFLVFFPGLIRTFQAEANLFKGLYENHRSLWEQLGQPIGFYWRPPGFGFSLPFTKMSQVILRNGEPTWLDRTPELRNYYYLYRAGVRRWSFVVLPVFGASILVCGILGMFY